MAIVAAITVNFLIALQVLHGGILVLVQCLLLGHRRLPPLIIIVQSLSILPLLRAKLAEQFTRLQRALAFFLRVGSQVLVRTGPLRRLLVVRKCCRASSLDLGALHLYIVILIVEIGSVLVASADIVRRLEHVRVVYHGVTSRMIVRTGPAHYLRRVLRSLLTVLLHLVIVVVLLLLLLIVHPLLLAGQKARANHLIALLFEVGRGSTEIHIMRRRILIVCGRIDGSLLGARLSVRALV